MVLDVAAPGMPAEVRDANILDRPKVIYQGATKKFVLYFKLSPPKEQGGKTGKDFADVGAATAATPTGPFEYQGRFLGGGSDTGSGDFAIFQDEDGAAYHIAVRKPDKERADKPLVCGRLSADGWKPAGPYVVMEGVENRHVRHQQPEGSREFGLHLAAAGVRRASHARDHLEKQVGVG